MKYFLVFNENVSINDFIFILVSLLIFLPVYFLFIRIMRIDFENINIVFGNKIYKRIVYAINTFLLVYCWLSILSWFGIEKLNFPSKSLT